MVTLSTFFKIHHFLPWRCLCMLPFVWIWKLQFNVYNTVVKGCDLKHLLLKYTNFSIFKNSNGLTRKMIWILFFYLIGIFLYNFTSAWFYTSRYLEIRLLYNPDVWYIYPDVWGMCVCVCMKRIYWTIFIENVLMNFLIIHKNGLSAYRYWEINLELFVCMNA